MTCHHVKLPGGVNAIVCRGRQRRKKCFHCWEPADLLCDWKIGKKGDGTPTTCDRPLCGKCSIKPAPDKDLCQEHARQWNTRQSA